MTCEYVKLEDGTTAIVCSRGRRRPSVCVVCQKTGADRLCDGMLDRIRYPRASKSKTCDRPLHRACAKTQGAKDFCPDHAPKVEQLGLL